MLGSKYLPVLTYPIRPLISSSVANLIMFFPSMLYHSQRIGFSSCTGFSEKSIKEALEKAHAIAKASPENPLFESFVSESKQSKDGILDSEILYLTPEKLADKVSGLLYQVDKNDQRIIGLAVNADKVVRGYAIGTTEGCLVSTLTTVFGGSAYAVVMKEGDRKTASEFVISRKNEDISELGKKAVAKGFQHLGSKPFNATEELPIVLHPYTSSAFLSVPFIQSLSGAAYVEKRNPLGNKLGKKIADERFNLIGKYTYLYDVSSIGQVNSFGDEKSPRYQEFYKNATFSTAYKTDLKTSLEKQYKVIDVDLSKGSGVRDDVNTLIIGGPKKELSERDKYEIDQFLMRGGKIIFLLDPVDLNPRGLVANEINTNLGDMLENYGVRVGKSLVLDRASNSNASFSSGFMQYSIPYPFWPRITKNQFSMDSPIVNQLENMVLPWAAPVEIIPSKVELNTKDNAKAGAKDNAGDTSKLKGIELFKTSQYSWTKGRPFNLSPQQRFIPTGKMKSYALGVAVMGKFKSFYAGKPVPERASKDTGKAASPEKAGSENTVTESPETQIIVVGNARFVTGSFLSRSQSNLLFVNNAVDWLTLSEDLISIRSRYVTDRPLAEISDRAKLAIKIIDICGASFLVIAFGLIRIILRRRAKKVFETYSALGGTG